MDAPSAPSPGPRRVTFVTNPDDCNLACPMCRERSPLAPRSHGPARTLAIGLVERILRERAGSRLAEVIPSTKGEPLLWSGVDRLVQLCSELHLALNVTTNGTFPGRGPRAWAELLVPVARDVKVSWNGATPETVARVMGGLRLSRALSDVRAFLEVRDARRRAGRPACRVSFQVTAQESNVRELPAVVALAAALGVERVKVNQLQVHFSELAEEDLRRSAASRARWNEAVAGMRVAAAPSRASDEALALENVEPWPEDGEPAFGRCRFLGCEAWVTADGRFAPCPAPAGQDGALGEFGSLEDRTLGAIWEGPAYRALVRGYEARPECRRCPLRRLGGA
jgi:MoaA/NifB/PqqE/SkfB family radical SAM enzyme